MSRIAVIDPVTATGEAKRLLDAVQSGLGMTPNFIRVLANAPVALSAFLGLHEIAGAGLLDPKTRERIALSVAEQNGCQYCVSAHTAIGRKAGLDNQEIRANRSGRSSDAKAEAALTFARALVAHAGEVTQAEFDAVRAAGHSDGEIVEIIAHVAMNIFTNLLGKATQVEIDFPRVDLNKAA
ncbi:MAG: carboxymuconolactone decarboxylase family protein [Rhodospirillales bacterium]